MERDIKRGFSYNRSKKEITMITKVKTTQTFTPGEFNQVFLGVKEKKENIISQMEQIKSVIPKIQNDLKQSEKEIKELEPWYKRIEPFIKESEADIMKDGSKRILDLKK